MITSQTPTWWEDANKHLLCDPKLKAVIESIGNAETMMIGGDPFMTLVRSITGQQISIHAAAAILKRLQVECNPLTPQSLLQLPIICLRNIGYSRRKAEYLIALANEFIAQEWDEHYLFKGDCAEVNHSLISVRGIGDWTVQMFNMFYRGEPNIFPIKDFGIVKSIVQLYFDNIPQTIDKIMAVAEPWQPYRTAASWYLWRQLDAKPVAY